MSHRVNIPILLEGWVTDVPQIEIDGLCFESGRARAGEAYVHAGPGRLEQNAAGCARVVICDDRTDLNGAGVHGIRVAGLQRRINELAARFYRHPAEQMKIAGIAGKRGRAAVAHYIAQSWRRVYGNGGAIGNAGNGHPADALSLQRMLAEYLDTGSEMAALELPPGHIEQGLAENLAFEAAVFTGLGESECRTLFTEYRPRFAIVNHDEADGKTLTRLVGEGVQVLTFGTNGATELQGSILAMDSMGMTLRLAGPWGGGEIRTGLLGRENLSSLLAAAGALALLGMPWNRVMHQVEIMSALPGQMTCVGGEPGQPTAVIDHARTPEALEDVLVALRSHLHGRLFCVLKASGSRRDEMIRVAESFADRVFPVTAITRSQAISEAIRESGRGDIVLVAGDGRANWRRNGEAEVRFLLEEAA